MKLLYAEDEPSMAEAVTDILQFHNFIVDAVSNGTDAYAFARAELYDGIILDVMMPGLDGLQVLAKLRQAGDKTPILLLTAKAEVEDRVAGLDAGADDYLPKPFSMNELLARVRAMLRRKETFTPGVLTFGNLSLNLHTFSLAGPGGSVALPKLEYQVMELLMLNHGIYLSTEEIFTKIWGYDSEAEIGVVWVYLTYLRRRLAALNANVRIRAKRNVGYTLEVIA